MARKHAREWKSGVMHRARLCVAIFQTTNCFTRHFIWPGARFARGLVGAVKLEHQFVFGCFPQQRLIEIDYFFGLVIEEIDLCAYYPKLIAKLKEVAAIVGRSECAAVLPDPDAYFLLPGVVGKFPHLRFAPLLPETFHDVVFKSQLSSEPGKFFHTVKRVLAAIQIFPDSPTWFDPFRVESRGKESIVCRRRDVADDVAVHQRV